MTEPTFIHSAADISECGTWRYTLTRLWSKDTPPLPVCMVNPSTADAFVLDPTIKRVVGFAQREGFGGILITNLFALRSTDPEGLKTAADPVGPANDHALTSIFEGSAARRLPVLVGWGKHGRLFGREAKVIAMAQKAGAVLVSLGENGDGTPRHPLYIAADRPFQKFTGVAS